MRRTNRFLAAFGRIAIPNITVYLIAFQVMCLFMIVGQPQSHFEQKLVFDAARVMQGEWWRVITFLFLPPIENPVFAFFAFYFFWLMGTALESHWGTARFNLFLLIGALATIGSGFLAYALGAEGIGGTNVYIGETVFLAFATLYPDFQIYLFFILPVKVKYLAILTGIMLCLQLLVVGWVEKAMLVAAVGNYLLFFSGDIVELIRRGKSRARQKMRQSALYVPPSGDAMHCCCVCKATEKTHPDYEFRYCSECGGKCYCLQHQKEHVHQQ
ncbi:MAG TPA: rhomboid family intramembrane serine protease [Phycisphaerae bacterium]|nr:rhomboid family intramembrane serine protease [Phycisphaerae bacterium]